MLYLLLCISLAAAYPGKYFQNTQRYDGHQILSVNPMNEVQANLVESLSYDGEVEFQVRHPGIEFSIHVPHHKLAEVKSFLEKHGVPYSVTVEDVQRTFEEEQKRLTYRFERNGGQFQYDKFDFNTLDDIMLELQNMRNNCPDGFQCELEDIGESIEGRSIIALRVYKDEAGRKGYWFDSTIHAREWISTTTLMLIMDHLIYSYGEDEDATRLLDGYDWHFIPVMNPDGYEYTWTNDRNWRKSRNINAGSTCMGTDLNRNHDYMWGNIGTSTDPCSNTYRGQSPADQPEIQHIQTYMLSVADDLLAMTSIHNAGRMWLTPYGHHTDEGQCAFPADYDDIMVVANAVADATQEVHNSVWTRGSICTTIYPAAGTTCDYGYGGAGIKYSFTPELRASSGKENIIPSYEETWQGVIAMVDTIAGVERL